MSEILRLIGMDWRDGLSILSTLVTVVGFGVTIYQLLQTKSAARAASESASLMLQENRTRFEEYSFANFMRYASELEEFASKEAWDLVILRLKDLAQQAMQLSQADPAWGSLTTELHDWVGVYRRIKEGARRDSDDRRKKWVRFLSKLDRKIAERHRPFGQSSGGLSP